METGLPVEQFDYDDEYLRNEGRRRADCERSNYFPLWKQLVNLIRSVGVPERPDVLEIGCGSGQLAQLLLREFDPEYVGVDRSSVAIRWAKELNPGDADRFVLGRVEDQKALLGRSWWAVIAMEALEHLVDDLSVLARLRRGTRVFFSVPTFTHPSHARYFTSEVETREYYERKLSIRYIEPVAVGRGLWLCAGATQ